MIPLLADPIWRDGPFKTDGPEAAAVEAVVVAVSCEALTAEAAEAAAF